MAKVMKQLTAEEKLQQQTLNTLAELGGRAIGEDDLEFGDKFVIPTMYKDDIGKAIDYLIKYKEQMEEETMFSRVFPYKPWDGACAVESAFQKYFGTKGVARATFFEQPEMISVPVGVGKTRQVMWGQIHVPIFRGIMRLGSAEDSTKFRVIINAAKKYQGAVEGLFKIIRNELDTNSIYRGKAFNGADMPEFIDTSKVDEGKLVFNEVTRHQLSANIWTPIRLPEIVKAQGVSTQRAMLLEGPFGTGKSEAGLYTAKVCEQEERTFIKCGVDDDVYKVLDMAAMYQPCTVFIEDIDAIANEGDTEAVKKYLDKFDGLTSKGKDIMIVMTTNHKDRIHKGMLRPGRLDAVMHMGALDREATERLLRKLFPNKIAAGVDFDAIYDQIAGDDPDGSKTGHPTAFTPAFIVEVASKVKLYATARVEGEPTEPYETMDFLAAVKEMRDHHNLHTRAGEGVKTPTLDKAMGELVLRTIDKNIRTFDEDNGIVAIAERIDTTNGK